MAKLELLWNVELPLFKILFNNDLFSAIEVKKLDDFLLEIWLNDEDLSTYKDLQKIDTSDIDRDRVNSYQNNIIDLFANKREFIKSTISKTEVFKNLTSNLRKKISVDNEKNLEIILYNLISSFLIKNLKSCLCSTPHQPYVGLNWRK